MSRAEQTKQFTGSDFTKKQSRDLAGSQEQRVSRKRLDKLNFSCVNTNRFAQAPRNFWPDLNPEDMELESECINRLDREEEYLNRGRQGASPSSGCIFYSAQLDNKSFESFTDRNEYRRTSTLWKEFRKKQIRIIGECESCGRKGRQRDFSIHHIFYGDFYDYFNEKYVMCLCHKCHAWVHERY
jgi:hypothetical protein